MITANNIWYQEQCQHHKDGYTEIVLTKESYYPKLKNKIKIFSAYQNDELFYRGLFTSLKDVTHLCLHVLAIDTIFIDALHNYLKNNFKLDSLHITANRIEENLLSINRSSIDRYFPPRTLSSSFRQFTNLRVVNINILSKRYGQEEQIKKELITINDFIKNNRDINELIIQLQTELNNNNQSVGAVNTNYKKMINLAQYYSGIWKICESGHITKEYLLALVTKNKRALEELKEAENWHPYMTIQAGNIERLKLFFTSSLNFDINAPIIYAKKNLRIIDQTDDTEIIEYLICNQNACGVTSACERAERVNREHNVIVRLQTKHKKLPAQFPKKQLAELVYDALAVLIYSQSMAEFKEILKYYSKHVEINYNLPIKQGAFTGYTLAQLLFLHGPDEMLIREIGLPNLSSKVKRNILNSPFPNNRYSQYCSTVLQYLVFKRKLNGLLILDEKIVLRNSDSIILRSEDDKNILRGYNLLQIFIVSMLTYFSEPGLLFNREHEPIKQTELDLYDFLMRHDHLPLWGDLHKLSLYNPCYEDIRNNPPLPIFAFAIAEHYSDTDKRYSFIFDRLFKHFFNFNIKVKLKNNTHLTLLQYSLVRGKDFYTANLFEWLLRSESLSPKELISLLGESTVSYDDTNYTFFQIIIERGLVTVMRVLDELRIDISSVVNQPYPTESLFPDWTPIQVTLYKLKSGRFLTNNMFFELLKNKNVSLTICFPSGYLLGLNILQGMIIHPHHDPCYNMGGQGHLFRGPAISTILNILPESIINNPCVDIRSKFYGKTALHLTVELRDNECMGILKELLNSSKVNYTALDCYNKTAEKYAKEMHNERMIALFNEAKSSFPQHEQNLRKGLHKYSDVNPSMKLTTDEWVISIVKEASNPWHWFLIIEGMTFDEDSNVRKLHVWISHFMLAKGGNLGLGMAKIKLTHQAETLDETHLVCSNLLLKSNDYQLSEGTRLYHHSGKSNPDKCKALIADIEKEKSPDKSDLKYSFFGEVSKSFFSGKNCWEWTAEKFIAATGNNYLTKNILDLYLSFGSKSFLDHKLQYTLLADIGPDRPSQQFRQLFIENDRLNENQSHLVEKQKFQLSALIFIVFYLLIKETDSCNIANSSFLPLAFLYSAGIIFAFGDSKNERTDNSKYNHFCLSITLGGIIGVLTYCLLNKLDPSCKITSFLSPLMASLLMTKFENQIADITKPTLMRTLAYGAI